jgi:hypothetical protein
MGRDNQYNSVKDREPKTARSATKKFLTLNIVPRKHM